MSISYTFKNPTLIEDIKSKTNIIVTEVDGVIRLKFNESTVLGERSNNPRFIIAITSYGHNSAFCIIRELIEKLNIQVVHEDLLYEYAVIHEKPVPDKVWQDYTNYWLE